MDLMSGFIGAVIAVLATYWLQEYARQKEHSRNINALLLSIKTEINALKERYESSISIVNEIESNPILSYFCVEQNYFLVLEGQSSLLGTVQDDYLRNLIIKTYIKIKSLIDSFKTNNFLVEQYENYLAMFAHNQIDHYNTLINISLQSLGNYAREIRKLENETKNDVENLITCIDLYLKKNS